MQNLTAGKMKSYLNMQLNFTDNNTKEAAKVASFLLR